MKFDLELILLTSLAICVIVTALTMAAVTLAAMVVFLGQP
jgi:hypothetical protein